MSSIPAGNSTPSIFTHPVSAGVSAHGRNTSAPALATSLLLALLAPLRAHATAGPPSAFALAPFSRALDSMPSSWQLVTLPRIERHTRFTIVASDTGPVLQVSAERAHGGLVHAVVPAASLMEEAMKTAEIIASMSLPIAMMTKETINRAYETPLTEGIRFERRVFHSQFSVADQKEGMAAFSEKRAPEFRHA